MKKLFALMVTVVMSFAFLTGCGNPVFDDFENFLNVEMKEINANYDVITEETGKWENIEEDAELLSSLQDVLIPTVEDSLNKLKNVTAETDEVKALKDKYVKVMEAYKEGFDGILAGLQEADEDKLNAGTARVEEGLKLLDEYNEGLEELAKEVDAEIEY